MKMMIICMTILLLLVIDTMKRGYSRKLGGYKANWAQRCLEHTTTSHWVQSVGVRLYPSRSDSNRIQIGTLLTHSSIWRSASMTTMELLEK